jgi:hypothetical protein
LFFEKICFLYIMGQDFFGPILSGVADAVAARVVVPRDP